MRSVNIKAKSVFEKYFTVENVYHVLNGFVWNFKVVVIIVDCNHCQSVLPALLRRNTGYEPTLNYSVATSHPCEDPELGLPLSKGGQVALASMSDQRFKIT